MANPFFCFKQFTVHQQQSAMKVCTDACLFGSLLPVNGGIKQALDIGAGTGLLSLMYAQKNTAAHIDSVELNADAAQEATENFRQSKWNDRLRLHHADIHDFAASASNVYDLIFSNPPFYENELHSPHAKNNLAHHSTHLSLQQLADLATQLLKPDGLFAVLLPYARMQYFTERMAAHKLYPCAVYHIKQTPAHDYFRSVLFLRRDAHYIKPTEIVIKDDQNQYTTTFTSLLKDYYLHL